jgi:hypothetical protein
LWTDDVALMEAVQREGAGSFAPRLAVYGALAGDELYRLGFDANRDRRACARMMRRAIASIRWSSIRPITS